MDKRIKKIAMEAAEKAYREVVEKLTKKVAKVDSGLLKVAEKLQSKYAAESYANILANLLTDAVRKPVQVVGLNDELTAYITEAGDFAPVNAVVKNRALLASKGIPAHVVIKVELKKAASVKVATDIPTRTWIDPQTGERYLQRHTGGEVPAPVRQTQVQNLVPNMERERMTWGDKPNKTAPVAPAVKPAVKPAAKPAPVGSGKLVMDDALFQRTLASVRSGAKMGKGSEIQNTINIAKSNYTLTPEQAQQLQAASEKLG